MEKGKEGERDEDGRRKRGKEEEDHGDPSSNLSSFTSENKILWGCISNSV